ncbi:rhodanese-like domain-containing protein [Cellulomonas rhizosphaerae]|uniref:Rhodanese-like domain-containing protein n=1 Tax=Cellulomonas rhizosphaerae TaxID=2293719 RepID=A0A413RHV2_9CELL|nr:rhodanese-like domain-containing protein [Cellulomonas rhizosphaerae]RHA37798.1 rhodanese-like domain-containing protein [Cellulomonas rhizosphaerae]
MPYAGDLTPQQAWELLASDESALLVDVRTDGEWRTIGVPDLTSLHDRTSFIEWVTPAGPNPSFLDQLAESGLEPGDERPVIFLCRSGGRSVAAAHAATAAGFGPSYNVLHGFEGDVGADGQRGHEGWQADGLPWRNL